MWPRACPHSRTNKNTQSATSENKVCESCFTALQDFLSTERGLRAMEKGLERTGSGLERGSGQLKSQPAIGTEVAVVKPELQGVSSGQASFCIANRVHKARSKNGMNLCRKGD